MTVRIQSRKICSSFTSSRAGGFAREIRGMRTSVQALIRRQQTSLVFAFTDGGQLTRRFKRVPYFSGFKSSRSQESYFTVIQDKNVVPMHTSDDSD